MNIQNSHKIEFYLEKDKIKKNESTVLSWNVEEADKLVLWKSSALAFVPETIDWWKIARTGKNVKLMDKITLSSLDTTTAYYLVAETNRELKVAKIVLTVEDEIIHKPITWRPQKRFLDRMSKSQFRWKKPRGYRLCSKSMTSQLSGLIEQLILKSCDPPSIDISVHPPVIFEDESATLTWNIEDATCARMEAFDGRIFLKEDTTDVSGTRFWYSMEGISETPPCSLEMDGLESFTPGLDIGPHYHRLIITARNFIGEVVSRSAGVAILPLPQVSACDASREREVKTAVKNIYSMLRGGCIVSNVGLDTTIDVFSRGILSREQLWSRMLKELENINLDTFICRDVEDANWHAGAWASYSNNIYLEWSPSHIPNLEYIILHELIHKSGFNDSLREHYTALTPSEFTSTIEDQAHNISGSCFD